MLSHAFRTQVVETYHGHECAIKGLKIDEKTGVLYSLDEAAVLKCWDADRAVLLNTVVLHKVCICVYMYVRV
jgi:hypothetical protein